MVVDTSALVAIAYGEPGWGALRAVFDDTDALIPAVVVVEFHRVTARLGNQPDPDAVIVIDSLVANGSEIFAFDAIAAEIAVAANPRFGSGSGSRAKLNMLDLMVYGIAMATGLPILCTGNDFASTDAAIHPASRVG